VSDYTIGVTLREVATEARERLVAAVAALEGAR
jgi:hypothetical protein